MKVWLESQISSRHKLWTLGQDAGTWQALHSRRTLQKLKKKLKNEKCNPKSNEKILPPQQVHDMLYGIYEKR